MRKLYFCCMLFLFSVTASVYGFSATKENYHYKKNLVVLAPNVDFSFTSDGSCSGTPIAFTSVVSGSGPFKYLWDFGDGSTSTDANPNHTFTAVGCGSQNFSVKLTVTDAIGGVNTIIKNVSVKQKPDLKFTNLNATAGSSRPFERCGDNNSDPKFSIRLGNLSASVACIGSYNVDWGDGICRKNCR